jgi:hypothetical protein
MASFFQKIKVKKENQLSGKNIVKTAEKKATLPDDFFEQILACEIQLKKGFSMPTLRKLINLYSKAVEYYESINDPRYLRYSKSLQLLLMQPQIVKQINMLTEKGKIKVHKQERKKEILDEFKNLDKKFVNNTNTNPNIKEIENSANTYKVLNERLKTEYNDLSLEAIDKMYEQDIEELNMNKNIQSKKDSDENSFRFFYPDGDVYNRDDEFFIENNEDIIDNNERKEKELDETETPLKMDTDKVSVENSGVLSFDQVKDIICYYNMSNTDKQSEFLFQNKEREIFDMNYKNKYINFFFGKKEKKN